MRIILFAILLHITTSAICQSPATVKLEGIKLSLVFAPDYCYRLLNYNSSYQWVEEIRNGEEMPTFGYTAGIGVKMNLTRKTVIETGLFYSVKGEQTKTREVNWVTSNTDLPMASKVQYHFTYIDIPLKFNYLLGGRKIKVFISSGVAMNIFIEKKSNVILEFNDGHNTSEISAVDLGYLRFNLSALIGIGIKYTMSNRFSIYAEPVYRQYLSSIVADRKASEYPYSIGASIGVYYSFRKK